jgi:hypothetical protein
MMVAHFEGQTEAGTEFIDGYTNARMVVVDSGRIILHTDDEAAFVEAAKARGLDIESA